MLFSVSLLAAMDEAGFAIVPKVPTPEMLEASWNTTRSTCPSPKNGTTKREIHFQKAGDRYTAMLAAAPKPI